MLGIPRPDFPEPPPGSTSAASSPADPEASSEAAGASGADVSSPSHRARARVRYDSADEPFPVVERRRKALRGLGLLVVLAGAWLAYRYLSLNG